MTSIRDRGLKRTFQPMQQKIEQGGQLQSQDVQALISSAQDGPGVTKTERKDLEKILSVHGQDMDPTARASLAAFIQTQTGGTGGTGGGGFSPLNMQIRNAGIRKALTGEDGGAAILADAQVSSAEAQRLLDIVNGNGVLSGREKRDLKTLLTDPGTVITGVARSMLEQAVGVFVEPPAHQQISGAAVASAHTDTNKTYRQQGLPTALLRQAGVPDAVADLLARADAVGGADGSGAASLDELVSLETGGVLLPAEAALLPQAYKLMEVQALTDVGTAPSVGALAAEDLSVRPSQVDVQSVEVAVSALPTALQQVAQRARMVAQGAGADLTAVTIADVQDAIANNHNQTTAADRQTMQDELLPALQPLAVEASGQGPLSAKAKVPDLGRDSSSLVGAGALQIDLHVDTKMGGTMQKRGSWSPMVKSHRRGSTAHYPSAIPKSSDVDLELSRSQSLQLNIPAGHKLMLVGKDSQAGRNHVFGPGQEVGLGTGSNGIVPGDYRAVLMKDGEVVDEAGLRLGEAKPQKTDISELYGYELETSSGQSVGLSRPGNAYGRPIPITASVGGTHQLPGSDAPVTLTPGRYEGNIKTDYNANADFALTVLPGNNLEVTMEGKTFRLFAVDASPTVYEGHLDDAGTEHAVLRFDPRNNELHFRREEMDTFHGSTGWHAEVETRQRGTSSILDSMRTG